MNNSTPDLATLIRAFERLAAIDNPIEFHLKFELEYKSLRLNQSTFKKAWQAWQAQQQGGQ